MRRARPCVPPRGEGTLHRAYCSAPPRVTYAAAARAGTLSSAGFRGIIAHDGSDRPQSNTSPSGGSEVVGEDAPRERRRRWRRRSRGPCAPREACCSCTPRRGRCARMSNGRRAARSARAVNFDWSEQPVYRGTQRAEFYWEGEAGSGAKLASALRGWEQLRFEVSEDPTPRLRRRPMDAHARPRRLLRPDRHRGQHRDPRGSHPLRDGGRRPRRARAAPRAAARARAGLGRRARAVPPRQ